ncbi:hypothetical protein VTL71DRAFT_15989 [Oculimacula yallundae]|uniref:Uncharacterized protein n=1 Tax=Oculimacula yallundae TaxID=86028 RepID=A0ABR4CF97_9HELO
MFSFVNLKGLTRYRTVSLPLPRNSDRIVRLYNAHHLSRWMKRSVGSTGIPPRPPFAIAATASVDATSPTNAVLACSEQVVRHKFDNNGHCSAVKTALSA